MSRTKPLFYLLAILFMMKGAAAAEITAVPFDALPEAVKQTAVSIIDKQSISKISKISEKDLLRFEIEADKTQNGHDVVAWDLVIAANGKLMKLAKEVPFFELSYPQMEAIEQRYPGLKVVEAESVDLHFFDVLGTVNGRQVKLRLYEDGLIEEQTNP